MSHTLCSFYRVAALNIYFKCVCDDLFSDTLYNLSVYVLYFDSLRPKPFSKQ